MAPLPTSLPLSLSLLLCAAGTIERVSASNKGNGTITTEEQQQKQQRWRVNIIHTLYIFSTSFLFALSVQQQIPSGANEITWKRVKECRAKGSKAAGKFTIVDLDLNL